MVIQPLHLLEYSHLLESTDSVVLLPEVTLIQVNWMDPR